MRKHIRLLVSKVHFLLYVAVYVHRRHSVKVSVSEESRVNQYQLVSLKDLLLTGQERIMLSQRSQQRRKARKLLLSVQVLQDLHVPETLQKWDMT